MSTIPDVTPKKEFLIWKMMGQGWDIMWKNIWRLVGYQIVLFALNLLLLGAIDLIIPDTPASSPFYKLANSFLSWIVIYTFQVGVITLSLRYADEMPVTLRDFFSKMDRALVYFCASILYGLCFIVGLLCLIVPGIIFAVRLSLYGYFVVDKNMGPIEALLESWYLVRGVSWRVFGLLLASYLVCLIGLLCLGIGLLFAYPTAAIATARLYRYLDRSNVVLASQNSL